MALALRRLPWKTETSFSRVFWKVNLILRHTVLFEKYWNPCEEDPAFIEHSGKFKHNVDHEKGQIICWVEPVPKGTKHECHQHCFVGLLRLSWIDISLVNVSSHPNWSAMMPVVHYLPKCFSELYFQNIQWDNLIPLVISFFILTIVVVSWCIYISILKCPGNVVLCSYVKAD